MGPVDAPACRGSHHAEAVDGDRETLPRGRAAGGFVEHAVARVQAGAEEFVLGGASRSG